MTSADPERYDVAAASVLRRLRRKGVKVWAQDGALRYRAPKGALTGEEIEVLGESGAELLALLQESTAETLSIPLLEPRASPYERVPLSFTQLTHWRARRIGERYSVRQLATALRLRGRIDIGLLRASLRAIVARQEALRTQIVVVDGVPMQEVLSTADHDIAVVDLSFAAADEQEAAVATLIDSLILAPTRVARDPLLGMCLAKLGDEHHVMIVVMEHLISDAYSMNIVLRDLFTSYVQQIRGQVVSLPEVPIQFADYAAWEHRALPPWLEKHGAYWEQRLAGCERSRFPAVDAPALGHLQGWGQVPLEIGASLKTSLRAWSRERRTTLVMSVFVAYVALIMRWCGTCHVVIRYQTDGRSTAKVANTIGFFAAILSLRIDSHEDATFIDLLDRATRAYYDAYEHADNAYLETRLPQPGWMANPSFNWVPQSLGRELGALAGTSHALQVTHVPFTHPVLRTLERDAEPSVLLYESEDCVAGGVLYARNRYSEESMCRFARNLLSFIDEVLRNPGARIGNMHLI